MPVAAVRTLNPCGHKCLPNPAGKVYATARNVAKMKGLDAIPNIELMALDVTDNENVVHVVDSIVQKEGRIDILVNNAGLACFGMNPTVAF